MGYESRATGGPFCAVGNGVGESSREARIKRGASSGSVSKPPSGVNRKPVAGSRSAGHSPAWGDPIHHSDFIIRKLGLHHSEGRLHVHVVWEFYGGEVGPDTLPIGDLLGEQPGPFTSAQIDNPFRHRGRQASACSRGHRMVPVPSRKWANWLAFDVRGPRLTDTRGVFARRTPSWSSPVGVNWCPLPPGTWCSAS